MGLDKFIALDIGSAGIRMAVFAREGKARPRLLDSGWIGFDLQAAAMTREAVVATALKRLLDEKKPDARKTVLAVDGQSVFFRLVKLPKVAQEKLGTMIRHEAVQNIPFSIGEVVWDAHIVNPDAMELEVVLFAVKNELVEGLFHAVRANGLHLERMEAAPVALANAVRDAYPEPDASVLLADGGPESTNLVFIDGDRMFFRSVPVGGDDTARLVREIERSVSYYQSQHGGSKPERILVAGSIKTLAPIHGVSAEPLQTSADSAVITGLACPPRIRIDLVPESLAKARRQRRRMPFLAAGAVLLLLLGGLWIYGFGQLRILTREESAQVFDRIETLEVYLRQMVPLEEGIARLETEAEAYAAAEKSRMFWLENMRDFKRVLPDGMFLLSSEPLDAEDPFKGFRVSVLSYLDKEPEGEDVVRKLRDALRASERFSDDTQVFSRPSKKLFARQFVLDVFIEEDVR